MCIVWVRGRGFRGDDRGHYRSLARFGAKDRVRDQTYVDHQLS
jgi:hypothetical protein